MLPEGARHTCEGRDRVRGVPPSAKTSCRAIPKDHDARRVLFGFVRSESLLSKLLGEAAYNELFRLVRRHRRVGGRNRLGKPGRRRERS
jgi:hypothetical protein